MRASAAILLLAAAPASATQVDFTGKLSAVTVYTSGSARVLREGPVSLAAGRTVLRSAPLPPSADPASVQVSLEGAEGKLLIEAVETRHTLIDDQGEAEKRTAHERELRAQEQKIFAIEQELQGLHESNASRGETLAFLAKIREQAAQIAGREMAVQKLDVESWGKALALAEERAERARKEMRELAAKRRDTERSLEEERRKLYELQAKSPAETHRTRVFATISAQAAASAKLTLAYNVAGARWQPAYRASADLKKNSATLDIFGEIRQNSGEDWEDVDLSLSSARPDIGTDVPELKTWYIRTAPQVSMEGGMKKAHRLRREAADEEIAALAGAAAPSPAEPEAPVLAESAGVATVFRSRAKATIPSDEQDHKIPVEQMTAAVELEHIAVPKVLPHAFLRAKTANRAPFPLLPGPIDVMVGESFVGRGRMKPTAPGEEIRLSLGIDENIKVERNLLSDKVKRRSSGDRVATTNVFAIKASNYSKKPVTLAVMDQLPISQSELIKVEYGGSARRALRGAEFPGQLKWDLALAPGATETIEFDFTIEYPQQMKSELMLMNSPAQQMMDMGQASYMGF